MGSRFDQERFQTGICSKTKFPRCKSNKCSCQPKGFNFSRNIETFKQKRYPKSRQNSNYDRFLQYTFLVLKINGEMQPVINLRPLNKYLLKKTFQDGLHDKSLESSRKRRLGSQVRLSDAYFLLKIYKPHRKFLRFSFLGQVYQFQAMSFGPTVAQRVYAKVTAVEAAHLRVQGIRLATYLDDWLDLNQIQKMLWKDRITILSLRFQLGFIENKTKSNFVPCQDMTYIGGHFLLAQGLDLPTPERVKGLRDAVQDLL